MFKDKNSYSILAGSQCKEILSSKIPISADL